MIKKKNFGSKKKSVIKNVKLPNTFQLSLFAKVNYNIIIIHELSYNRIGTFSSSYLFIYSSKTFKLIDFIKPEEELLSTKSFYWRIFRI